MNDSTPTQFTAGDVVEWTWSAADWSSIDGYTSFYVFVVPGVQKTVAGSPDGSGGWTYRIESAASAAWIPGQYGWQRYVSLLGDRRTTGTGRIAVAANFEAATVGVDPRAEYEKTIDAIDATLQGRAGSDIASYTVGGRSLAKMTVSELLQLRGYYAGLLNKYLQQTGQGGQPKIIRMVL